VQAPEDPPGRRRGGPGGAGRAEADRHGGGERREVTVRSPGAGWTPGPPVGDPPGMTDQRYSIPVDELVSSARVDVTDQVELQAEPRQPPAGWSPGVLPYGDGMSGDADGD
jgi:hypothetical protein